MRFVPKPQHECTKLYDITIHKTSNLENEFFFLKIKFIDYGKTYNRVVNFRLNTKGITDLGHRSTYRD
jgi:hypothetical protein